MKLAIAAIGSAALAAAPGPDQFDLVCKGQKIELGAGAPVPVSWDNHYRIDISNFSWCAGECDQSFQLKGVTEQTIKIGSGSIDRVSGKLTMITVSPLNGRAFRIEADCVPQEFSGLPRKKF